MPFHLEEKLFCKRFQCWDFNKIWKGLDIFNHETSGNQGQVTLDDHQSSVNSQRSGTSRNKKVPYELLEFPYASATGNISDRIGEGYYGSVYKSTLTGLKQEVAVKLSNPNATGFSMVNLAKLAHDINRARHLNISEFVDYLRNTMMPRVIYRDLKASNILLDGEGLFHPKLSRFGIGQFQHAGRLGYCVPKLDAGNDGVSLKLLTGRRAFEGPRLNPLFAEWARDIKLRSHEWKKISDPEEDEQGKETSFKASKLLVIGHRGNGMNILDSSDVRMKSVKENTILSFNTAAKFPVDFIEFDVQVTKDGCPIIFHDNFIYDEDINGTINEKRVTDLSLSEFLSYGPQKEDGVVGKKMLRKTKDGKIFNWSVESDDCGCTLEEAFEEMNSPLGFNIELKFDDCVVYEQEHLTRSLQAILRVVSDHAKGRRIIFSSFHPDAALIVKKLQSDHPVFFLTYGGSEIHKDVRRNSLDEAIKVCFEGGLQGIVSEVRGVFGNPESTKKIKESNLSLLTFGKLNNVPEAVYMQHLMGVEGVIVDLVQEITEAVSKMLTPSVTGKEDDEEVKFSEGDEPIQGTWPQFSQTELSFLSKLIAELMQK